MHGHIAFRRGRVLHKTARGVREYASNGISERTPRTARVEPELPFFVRWAVRWNTPATRRYLRLTPRRHPRRVLLQAEGASRRRVPAAYARENGARQRCVTALR